MKPQMEAHNVNLVTNVIVSFTWCIFSQEVRESSQYPQSLKTFYRMYDIVERNTYNSYRL